MADSKRNEISAKSKKRSRTPRIHRTRKILRTGKTTRVAIRRSINKSLNPRASSIQNSPLPKHTIVDQQHHDAADERDQDAPKVESGYAMAAKNAEYNTANDAPYDA
jgi:hypothetical protein